MEEKARNRFVLFMFTGIAGIATAAAIKHSQGGAGFFTYLLAIGAPALSLFLYGWLAHSDNKEYARTAGFADSLYYMGFLLTLAALVAALIGYSILPETTTEGPQSSQTRQVLSLLYQSIPEFGTALISTILGMTGRIYLVGFRNDPEEIDQMQRDALESAMQSLRVRAEDFDTDLAKASEAWRSTVASMQTKAVDDLRQSGERMTAAIDEGTHSLRNALEGLTVTVSQNGSAIAGFTQEVIVSTREALDGLTAQIQKAAAGGMVMQEMSEKLAAATNHLSETISELAAVNPKRAGEATQHYIENLQSFTERFDSVSQRAEESVGALEQASASAAEAKAQLDELDIAPLQENLRQMNEAAERTRETTEKTAQELERAADLLPRIWTREFWRRLSGRKE